MNKNKVIKNAGWMIGGQIAQSVFGLIIAMITARYLGPSNYGIISYAASIVAFMVPIMYLGLSHVLVQETVNCPEDSSEIFGTAIGMSMVSAVLCIGGIAVFSCIANRGETETIIVCILYSFLLVFQAADLLRYWFQAKLMSRYISLVSFAAYFVTAMYKVFLLISGKSIRWFAVSNALDYMIIAAAFVIIYKKLGNKPFTFSIKTAKRLFSKSRYYIISSLMVTIFAQTDRIMIKHMLGSSETGYYSAAVACASLTAFIFSAMIDSMRPIIFESKKNSEKSFQMNMMRLYAMVIYLSLLQCIGITLFSGVIIKIIYGSAYLAAVPALRIVVWYTTFSYLGSVRNIWILAQNKQKYLWMINLSGALMNVILNYFLIPVWGICGAAFASLATQIFTNVVIGYIIKPIRENNRLMIQSLSPKYLSEILTELKRMVPFLK